MNIENLENNLERKTTTLKENKNKGLTKPELIKRKLEIQKSELDILLKDSNLTAEKLNRIALTAIKSNPKLLECSIDSLIMGVMRAAQLGLEIGNEFGFCYLIPFKDQAQFVLGYQGLIELLYRTNIIKSITAQPIYEKDYFEIEYGTSPRLIHQPILAEDRGKIRGYYACIKTINDGFLFKVMSHYEMEEHKNAYCPSSKIARSPWNNSLGYNEMACKTVLKKVVKLLPKSSVLSLALNTDETIQKDIESEFELPPTIEQEI